MKFNDIVLEKPIEATIYALIVPFENLELSSISCEKKELNWQKQQTSIMFSIIKNFLSKDGSFELNEESKYVPVEDEWNRVVLIKQIVELFDKPYLKKEI